MSRVFTNGLGDRGSIPGQVIPKTQNMVLDDTMLNTQHYKVQNKDKVEESREWSSALPLHLGVVTNEKDAFGHSRLRLPILLTFTVNTVLVKKEDNCIYAVKREIRKVSMSVGLY